VRDPRERLLDILTAISAIERYRDRDRATFEQDELLQSWILRHLQIIGEALGQRSITPIRALHRCTTEAMQQCNGESEP